jgi:hypothetical protein
VRTLLYTFLEGFGINGLLLVINAILAESSNR